MKKKKPVQKKNMGKMLASFSPAAALMKSMKSGEAEGILGMTPMGAMHNAGRKKSGVEARSTAQKTPGMKTGGRVRGDGICQRGKTKGTMR